MHASKRTNWPVTIALLIASLAILYPLLLALIVSMKTPPELARSALALPTRIYFGNYAEVFREVDYLAALRNSVIITGFSVVLVVVTNSMVGYAIARNMHRWEFKASYFYLVSGIFVPFNIIMLPLIKLLYWVHLNNFVGIILGYVFYSLSTNVFLTVGYLRSVPLELEESAIIDGAGANYTFWRIVFPLMKPINSTMAVFTMISVWNDFLLPNLLIRDNKWMTLPLIQYVFQGQFHTQYNLAFASYLMALLPAVVFYMLAQKWVVNGLTSGALKG